jgi:ribosomal protein S2
VVAYTFASPRSNSKYGRPFFNLRSAIKIWKSKDKWWVFYQQNHHVFKLPYYNGESTQFNDKNKKNYGKFSGIYKIAKYKKLRLMKNYLFINFSKFFQLGISIAGATYKTEPEITPYLSGIFKKNDIYNSRWNYFVYRQTFLFLSRSQNWSRRFSIYPPIMHIASRDDLHQQNRIVANFLNHQHVSVKWIGGILTNTRLRGLRKFISNARAHGLTGKEMRWFNIKSFRRKLDLPAVILIWDTHHNDYAVNDAIKLKIPVIGVVDNLVNPRRIIYPLLGHNFEKEVVAFYQNFFIKIFLEGYYYNVDTHFKEFTPLFFMRNNYEIQNFELLQKIFSKKSIFHYFVNRNYKKVFEKIKKIRIYKKKNVQNSFLIEKNLNYCKQNEINFFERVFSSSSVRHMFRIYNTFGKWMKIYRRMEKRKLRQYKAFLKRKVKFKFHQMKFFRSNFFYFGKSLFKKSSRKTFNFFRNKLKKNFFIFNKIKNSFYKFKSNFSVINFFFLYRKFFANRAFRINVIVDKILEKIDRVTKKLRKRYAKKKAYYKIKRTYRWKRFLMYKWGNKVKKEMRFIMNRNRNKNYFYNDANVTRKLKFMDYYKNAFFVRQNEVRQYFVDLAKLQSKKKIKKYFDSLKKLKIKRIKSKKIKLKLIIKATHTSKFIKSIRRHQVLFNYYSRRIHCLNKYKKRRYKLIFRDKVGNSFKSLMFKVGKSKRFRKFKILAIRDDKKKMKQIKLKKNVKRRRLRKIIFLSKIRIKPKPKIYFSKVYRAKFKYFFWSSRYTLYRLRRRHWLRNNRHWFRNNRRRRIKNNYSFKKQFLHKKVKLKLWLS